MARTPYATVDYNTSQKGPRVPDVTPSFIVIHHAATVSFDAVISLEMGAREVSSTVIIKDDQAASMFDESYRAWSLSSQYWDSVSLSSETCNETTAPGWTISEASYATLAKVVADWCTRYGIACNRTQILGHREVYTRYGASYATACPGGIDLDRVVNDANLILAGGTVDKPKETKVMETYHREDRNARDLAPGAQTYLRDVAKNTDLNVVGQVGAYAITPHLYAEGLDPEDSLQIVLVWENTANDPPSSKMSPHYAESVRANRDGVINHTVTFQRGVASGDMVFVRVTAPETNKNTAKITLIDCDAYSFATV